MAAYVVGSGTALPETVVTNEEIAERLGLTPEQIFKSSGIRRRRWAQPGQTTAALACDALRPALEDARLAPGDIDYLLFGTMTPDRFIPGCAPAVQQRMGLGQVPALDLRAACCNALYALQVGGALIRSGAAKRVAVCLADVQSPWLDLSPQAGTTSMLFGDGAAALILSDERTETALEILDVVLATDGSFLDDLGIRAPGTEFGTPQTPGSPPDYRPRMKGQSVILQASRKLTAACRTVLERNQLGVDAVRWMVPHQANANLLAQVARSLGFPAEGVISQLEDLGNTSSASMGIALDQLRRSGRVERGDVVLLPAFAAGFTWGAGLCRA
jgi:3-oxoacyl-[acyl-carrier-protein] synthase III